MASEIPLPTSHLPPIKHISSQDINSLNASIHYLRTIYNPEVRGSRRRRNPNSAASDSNVTHWGKADSSTADKELSFRHLRSDSFERSYSIRWLTALIAQLGSDDCTVSDTGTKERTIQDAASLLAICAGTASAGTIIRDFTFQHDHRTGDDEPRVVPITVKLTDIPLDNRDYGSLGSQTWGGACVLSEMIVEDPNAFGLSGDQLAAATRRDDDDNNVFRILELGAGTGLVSLVVGKLLENIGFRSQRRIEIVATDYYPSVMENLHANIQSNTLLTTTDPPVTYLAHPLDWSRFGAENTLNPPFNPPFDMVLGADIIYEADHAAWIRSCLTHLLRKLDSSQRRRQANALDPPLFHLVIPLRPTHQFESGTVESIFSADDQHSHQPSLQVVFKDIFVCDTESGEEVEYAYYKIGWA